MTEYASKLVASNQSSKFSGGTSEILSKERATASFTVENMTNVLDGGKKETARRRFIRTPMEGKDFTYRYGLDRQDSFADHIHEFIEAHKKFPKFKPTRKDIAYMSDTASIGGTSGGNHLMIFMPTITGQGDPEQVQYWLEKIMRFQIIGAYAQTELGHGSNVRGLQTTATYDKATQEFVLSTPTLQAIKWWPGALGKAATHGAFYAQLIIDGKEYGVHVFMCQIRDENHLPLPGIQLGDLGTKVGDTNNDTGYCILDNVRIPRRFILMKHATVSPEGVYSRQKISKQAAYATMMYTRAQMTVVSGSKLGMAATITARWSAIRQQGFQNTSADVSYKSEEHPILNYKIQQYRVLKQIAIAYALKLNGRYMIEITEDLDKNQDVKKLKEFAAISAGMKSVCIKIALDGIEDLRKSCGGAGYLLHSGIAQLGADYLWQVTAEGDYVILSLLTARFLVKAVGETTQGKKQKGQLDYLNQMLEENFDMAKAAPMNANNVNAYTNDIDYLLSWFRYRALVYVVRAARLLQRKMTKEKKSIEESWNESSLELNEATWAHCLYMIMQTFVQQVKTCEDAPSKVVLARVCALFACSQIHDENWGDVVPQGQYALIRQAQLKLMESIRPDTIALVDAFDFTDTALTSSIGRKDGNVYEAMFKAAQTSPLNRTEVFKGYEKVLRPHLDLEFLKLGNKLPQPKL